MDEEQATLSPAGSTEDLWRDGATDEPIAEAHTSALTRDLTIPGKPMTWSRVRTGGGQFFTPDDRRDRMNQIGLQWRARHPRRFEKDTPLAVRLVFVFDRPKSHFGTGRNAAVLKHDARQLRPGGGTNGGDLDNLIKLVLDSLNAIAYHDDRQIADLRTEKRYISGGEKPHTFIEIRPLF